MINRIRSEIVFRLRSVFRRSAVERELDDELRFHIDREAAKLVSDGVPRAEAERLARASFGGLERIKDDTRDSRGTSFLDETAQDLRYAMRGLRARKAFTFGVVVTLALGIGANATMFGIVDRLLFRAPPSLRDAATVHRLYRHSIDDGQPRVDRNLSFATYLDLKQSLTSFSEIAAFQTTRFAVGDGEAVRELPVTVASANYFGFFTAQPVRGRFFTAAEDSIPFGSPVVVLGHAFWKRQFGGRDAIGEQLRVGATLRTIIGVAPPGFVGMSDQGVPAVYMPITAYAGGERGDRYVRSYNWSWLETIARRKPGVSVERAEAELAGVFIQSWRNANATNPNWGTPEAARVGAELTPVQMGRGPQASRDSQVAKWIGGVALIILLIACANVTSLLLARAMSRRRELAVRMALGASRSRLTRQLLTEGVILASVGAVAGLAIAQWGAAGLRRWFLPTDLDVGVFTDMRTLAFAALATIVVALMTAVAPAFRAGRADVARELKTGSRGSGQQLARLRTGLLVFQVALSAVLLVGAGLFVRSLQNANGYRLGYDADHVLYATMRARDVRLTMSERLALNDRLLAAAKSVPGVTHVTEAMSVPFQANDVRGLEAPGVDSVDSRGMFIYQLGSPDYFATTGTKILRGRAFDANDRAGTMPVVVVSERMARAIWRDKDALGQCLRFAADPNAEPNTVEPCMTVIGIAEEMHLRSWSDDRESSYYVPALQRREPPELKLFARVTGATADIVEPFRRRLQAEMPGSAYISVFPMSRLVAPNLRSWKLGAAMFVAFGALALVLAAVGLYSLIAYDVAQRRRELSVRIALGATLSRIMGWVVGRGVRLVAMGLVVGGGIAMYVAPTLESQLFQQDARDPVVFGIVVATLIIAGLAATVVPALRAARVDPNDALREE